MCGTVIVLPAQARIVEINGRGICDQSQVPASPVQLQFGPEVPFSNGAVAEVKLFINGCSEQWILVVLLFGLTSKTCVPMVRASTSQAGDLSIITSFDSSGFVLKENVSIKVRWKVGVN